MISPLVNLELFFFLLLLLLSTVDSLYLDHAYLNPIIYIKIISKFRLLYPRHTKYVWVDLYSFHFSVRPFICTLVCSCSSFHHRVKVFALKFTRPHILKTLWWISFIFGMMVDIGLKFLSAPSPPQGWPWGQGHGLRISVKNSMFFVFKFI